MRDLSACPHTPLRRSPRTGEAAKRLSADGRGWGTGVPQHSRALQHAPARLRASWPLPPSSTGPPSPAATRRAWGAEAAPAEVQSLLDHGVTLFVDLTQEGELEPYEHLVPAAAATCADPSSTSRFPPSRTLVTTLDILDGEIDAGGLVYVHCWAGCGRTGVVVGSWLVRHGTVPARRLARIAEPRGPGCPQTLQQQLVVLGWQAGR